jgi:hypothetical protein
MEHRWIFGKLKRRIDIMGDKFNEYINFLKNNQDAEQGRLKYEALPEACRLLFENWKDSKKEYEQFFKESAKEIVLQASKKEYIDCDLSSKELRNYIFNEINNYLNLKFKDLEIEYKIDIASYFIYLIYFIYLNKKYNCHNLKLCCKIVDSEENWIAFYKAENLREEEMKKNISIMKKFIK